MIRLNLKRPKNDSLGKRIAGQYALHFARTALLTMAVMTLLYWVIVIAHGAGVCQSVLQQAQASRRPTGCYLIEPTGLKRDTSREWVPGLFPQRANGSLYLVRGSGDYTAVYGLRTQSTLFVALLLALAACEGVRLYLLHRRADDMSARALRPISDIAAAARGLSASNLSERIRSDDATGEMDELIRVLNGMLNRIEAAYNNQKQFASDASHELRTPIAVIQGYADMLQRWGKTDPEICDEAASAISAETRAMQELVEQLLFIARHENSAHRYDMDFFDLSELIGETVRETNLIVKDREVTASPLESAIVCADRGAIKQALRVFIDNAVKYTAPGGHIAVSCVKEPGWARVTVADDGIGIAAEDLPHVFDRFYRAADVRGGEVSGHGLGLAIARMIVKAHDGRLEVTSKSGGGSRFHMLLKL